VVADVLDLVLSVSAEEDDDGVELGVVEAIHGGRRHVQETGGAGSEKSKPCMSQNCHMYTCTVHVDLRKFFSCPAYQCFSLVRISLMTPILMMPLLGVLTCERSSALLFLAPASTCGDSKAWGASRRRKWRATSATGPNRTIGRTKPEEGAGA
jgi:hypothetical protein